MPGKKSKKVSTKEGKKTNSNTDGAAQRAVPPKAGLEDLVDELADRTSTMESTLEEIKLLLIEGNKLNKAEGGVGEGSEAAYEGYTTTTTTKRGRGSSKGRGQQQSSREGRERDVWRDYGGRARPSSP